MTTHYIGNGLSVDLPAKLTFAQYLVIDTALCKVVGPNAGEPLQGGAHYRGVLLDAAQQAGLIGAGWEDMLADSAAQLSDKIAELYAAVIPDPKA